MDDAWTLFLTITVPVIGIIIAAVLGYFLDRKAKREFSMIEKMWDEKYTSFKELTEKLWILHGVGSSYNNLRQKPKASDPGAIQLVTILLEAMILYRFYGIKSKSNSHELIETSNKLNEFTKNKQENELINEVQVIKNELSLAINQEIINLMDSILKLANQALLIVEDHTIIEDIKRVMGQIITTMAKPSFNESFNAKEIEKEMDTIRENLNSIAQKERKELDRTRTGRLKLITKPKKENKNSEI